MSAGQFSHQSAGAARLHGGRRSRPTAGPVPQASSPVGTADGGDARADLVATVLVLLLALLFQGSGMPRHMADFAVQICAVPLLVLTARRFACTTPGQPLALFECLFPLFPLVLLVAQLVPVPPVLRTWFAADEPVMALRELAGADIWRPVSLAPRGTLAALLFLVCPTVLFYAVRQLSWRGRRILVRVVMAVAVVNILVALVQAALGPKTGLNFYGTATQKMSTGLFASQNHYPAILYVTIPFCFALARRARERQHATLLVVIPALVAAVCFLVLGGLLSQSRAGIALTFLSLLISVVVFRPAASQRRWVSGAALLIAIIPLLYVVDRYFGRIYARLDANPMDDYRRTIFATTIDAIYKNLPLGTGFGSFVDVYQIHEISDKLIPPFINAAHNDYLQIALEGGIAGALLIVVFLLWYIMKVVGLIMGHDGSGRYEKPAAAIAIFLVLLHSLVEYPLHTGALAAVFAVFCAFLIDPRGEKRPRGRTRAEAGAGGFPVRSSEAVAGMPLG